ncbi:MAG: efflux RND transporter permease subunit [Acidobacteriota bacterium]
MKVVDAAIRSPVKTAVGAILLSLFGSIALTRIPIQLTPTIEEPEISVSTLWPGASPKEVEREIIDEQEEQLKSLAGLREMESMSYDGFGQISLKFVTGTDLDSALLKVSNGLEQVLRYPADAERPIIQAVGAQASPMAWFLFVAGGEKPFEGDLNTLRSYLEDYVKPEFERVPGVGAVNIFAGTEQEMHVVVDPAALAARQITITEFTSALERENRNYSAGDFDEGKRRYLVRTTGEYSTPEDIENVVVVVRDGVPVYVRDVATVALGFEKPFAAAYYLDKPMIAFNVVRETGANVLEVMKGLRQAMDIVNRELLEPRGLALVLGYDETDYIYSAIVLVEQNLFVGGFLAIAVLLVFLRSRSSTLVVAIAIPISVIGTFLMMNWLGRSLNVISLAGMAFAVGMVVDNSIVVLENIYRHRQMGKSRFEAASKGTAEVWGAVLASTLTTIAVFLPVLFVQEEAGQLFRDIAIAISCAVGLSLIVSVTVIPSLSAKILGSVGEESKVEGFRNLWGLVDRAHGWNERITKRVGWILATTGRRLVVVIGLTTLSIGLSWALMPRAEYLPSGNQNLLFGVILPPPGHSIEENAKYLDNYVEELSPLWELPPVETKDMPGGGLDGMFFVAFNNQVFMGVRSRDQQRVAELIPEFQKINSQLPGAFAFINQRSIFQRGMGRSRNIDVELTGPDIERLVALGGEVFQRTRQVLPEAQARPIPSLDLGNPEVLVKTDRRRAAELGISNRDLGLMVNVLVDGAKASEYQYQGREIDLLVMADLEGNQLHTQSVAELPLASPSGELITVGSVAEVIVENGPAEIAHKERQRAITIAISPPANMPLQSAMDAVESQILEPMRDEGKLGRLYRARLTGTADKLTQTGRALAWNFVLAIVITYLLMAALFESFLHPFVILFSVPLAALGGFLGLATVNLFTYQSLDVLTMLGFIILVGTVVNNAILIVHQSLNHMREDGMEPNRAITESVRNRIRPIFMSVSTSVCGMLPLVLFPGAGSELYRGLGSVVVGGLIVSTIFTLFLVPALFSLVLEAQRRIRGRIETLVATPEQAPKAPAAN